MSSWLGSRCRCPIPQAASPRIMQWSNEIEWMDERKTCLDRVKSDSKHLIFCGPLSRAWLVWNNAKGFSTGCDEAFGSIQYNVNLLFKWKNTRLTDMKSPHPTRLEDLGGKLVQRKSSLRGLPRRGFCWLRRLFVPIWLSQSCLQDRGPSHSFFAPTPLLAFRFCFVIDNGSFQLSEVQ